MCRFASSLLGDGQLNYLAHRLEYKCVPYNGHSLENFVKLIVLYVSLGNVLYPKVFRMCSYLL